MHSAERQTQEMREMQASPKTPAVLLQQVGQQERPNHRQEENVTRRGGPSWFWRRLREGRARRWELASRNHTGSMSSVPADPEDRLFSPLWSPISPDADHKWLGISKLSFPSNLITHLKYAVGLAGWLS